MRISRLHGALIAALLAVFAPASALAAEEVTAAGVARSASLMEQIASTCSGLFSVDRNAAERYAKAFREGGERAFGKKNFSRELAQERPRRAQEVQEAGAESWCAEQRERLKAIGGGGLFRD